MAALEEGSETCSLDPISHHRDRLPRSGAKQIKSERIYLFGLMLIQRDDSVVDVPCITLPPTLASLEVPRDAHTNTLLE